MNKKALTTLEFNKMITALSGQASSEPGRQLCEKLEPMVEIEEINKAQIETADALSRLFKKGSISFRGNIDITNSLK